MGTILQQRKRFGRSSVEGQGLPFGRQTSARRKKAKPLGSGFHIPGLRLLTVGSNLNHRSPNRFLRQLSLRAHPSAPEAARHRPEFVAWSHCKTSVATQDESFPGPRSRDRLPASVASASIPFGRREAAASGQSYRPPAEPLWVFAPLVRLGLSEMRIALRQLAPRFLSASGSDNHRTASGPNLCCRRSTPLAFSLFAPPAQAFFALAKGLGRRHPKPLRLEPRRSPQHESCSSPFCASTSRSLSRTRVCSTGASGHS